MARKKLEREAGEKSRVSTKEKREIWGGTKDYFLAARENAICSKKREKRCRDVKGRETG